MDQSEDTHNITVDGFKVGTVCLPEVTTQQYRDVIRHELAKKYQAPVHYLRFSKIKRKR